jgi:DNA-binding beta-propeller fold protein YncE
MSRMFRLFYVLFWIGLWILPVFSQDSQPVKLRVIVDGATVKVSPDIDGETLARIPLRTVLDVVEKQGDWYKVTFQREGLKITGFVHEMLVREMTKDEVAEEEASFSVEGFETQSEITQEIENRIEESRQLIRQKSDYKKAIESLDALIAHAFRVEDHQKQRKMAAEIYLWTGMAYAGKGDDYSALQEIRKMFGVDHEYGKEITRNILDPKIMGLVDQAEKEFLGLIKEYSLRITTEPGQVELIADGKSLGYTPFLYRSKSPLVSLELKKKGYKSAKDEIFLNEANTEKHYVLERLGRNLKVGSIPQGAKVLLDGTDSGQRTDCVLSFVPFGAHKLNLRKENYAEWEGDVDIPDGAGPLSISVSLTGKNYVNDSLWGGPDSQLFDKPKGIALDADNFSYVVDESDAKLIKIAPGGEIDPAWASKENDFRDLKDPADIAIDARGDIYATDTKRNCVMKFDKDGKLIKKWGKEGSGETQFRTPLGIAVDADLNVYVADSVNHCVKKYSNLGLYLKTIGERGTGDGEFIFPADIAINRRNEVFVVDRTRVQKFSSEGEFLASWGGTGNVELDMHKPMGIAIDGDGYVYIVDTGNNRIDKFDETGELITSWGGVGTEEGQLNYPIGIAVDSSGKIFIVERDNNRIQVFSVKSGSEKE